MKSIVIKKAVTILTALSICQGVAGVVVSAEQSGFSLSNEKADSMLNSMDGDLRDTIEYIINDKQIGDVIDTHDLLDVDGNTIAYCWDFDCGYIIFNDVSIIEFSDENESPYAEVTDDSYYCGVSTYYTKDDSGFVSLMTDNVVDYDKVTAESYSFTEQMSAANVEVMSYEPGVELYSGYDVVTNAYLPGVTRRLNMNTDNTCGSLAAEIMLYYFKDYINDNYVNDYLASDVWRFYDYLKKRLEPEHDMSDNYGGSNDTALATRLRTYLPYIPKDKTGLKLGVEITYGNAWGYALHLIRDEKIPMMVGVSNEPTYGGHWLVGYGVYMTGPNAKNDPLTNYYISNDGQGRLGVYINKIYVDSIINLY